MPDEQRNDEPRRGNRSEPVRQARGRDSAPAPARYSSRLTTQPVRSRKRASEPSAGSVRVDRRHVPARRRPEAAVLVAQPERAARALDQVGERLDARAPRRRGTRALRRERAREAQPFVAIVVAIGEEMLADEDAELRRGSGPRTTTSTASSDAREQKLDLQRPAPVAAEEADDSSRPPRSPAGTTPDTSSAVEWKTTPRDMCISIVQPVLRAVDIATNGMTSALATPRATQMSASRRPNSIASAKRKRSKAKTPASPTHSGLMLQRACGCARRSSCSTRISPKTARPSRSAEFDERAPARPVELRPAEPSDSATLATSAARRSAPRPSAAAGAGASRRAPCAAAPASRLARNANQHRIAQRVERVRREPRRARRRRSRRAPAPAAAHSAVASDRREQQRRARRCGASRAPAGARTRRSPAAARP